MEACQGIHHRWTLRGLVASFVDLALVYLFLCAAAFAFFVSKALSFVGLSAPCSCDLVLIERRPQRQRREQKPTLGCLQRFLLDYPAGKIGGVFDSVCTGESRASRVGRCDNFRLVNRTGEDRGGASDGGGMLEMDRGEESCSSVSQPRARDSKNLRLLNNHNYLADRGESSNYRDKDFADVKGNAVLRQERSPNVLKRWRLQKKNISIKRASLSDLPSSAEVGRKGEMTIVTPLSTNDPLPLVQSIANAIPGTNYFFTGDQNAMAEEVSSTNALQTTAKVLSNGIGRFCDEDKNECDVTRELRQALKEERSARAALYQDLEKERSAAASAADEAMAMILRLQKEKSAIQMEARQYGTMAEEKSAYDEEEMKILKDIIVRQEREKYALQKEVEAYQQMLVSAAGAKQISGSDPSSAVELIDNKTGTSIGSFDDTELMLKTVYESIKKNERFCGEVQRDEIEFLVASGQKSFSELAKEPTMTEELQHSSNVGNQCNAEEQHSDFPIDTNDCHVQEKGMLTIENILPSIQSHESSYGNGSSSPRLIEAQYNVFHDPSIYLSDTEDKTQDRKSEVGVSLNDLCIRKSLRADEVGSISSQVDTEASVLDVHVIDDEIDMNREGNMGQLNTPQVVLSRSHRSGVPRESSSESNRSGVPKESSSESKVHCSTENLNTSLNPLDTNIHRRSSDVITVCHSVDVAGNRVPLLDMRRISMPVINNERCKLENEVEFLRKKLKVIQEGRENCNFSAEKKEKETRNLQRLEEIACQLQEIRKATEF
ncbi:uncharacterized protein LOC121971636 isoform X1 [Zingiber officinale]|uniref:GTD-binding domain-containing protein n=1 Tax=Zingiber officinale TaxID=94328 RepID=A0A8J5GXR5_ZINOF|nr:uncharacterized protein LOC121971636 isoform X1 [Zingiber officinale]XP_042378927.1 uncharacterized protein LOC121971636 isoform X1 [Zingiber officinale]KAG6516190.1 hypothetical protein ZIOFF_026639 [Zingiber officinale]